MIRLVILICLLLPASCFPQAFINKSRDKVKRDLEKRIASDTIHTLLLETDTSLQYSIRDSQFQPADFIYTFDQSGKCKMEEVIASCDSCLHKFLQSALGKKGYGWKKLNDHLYISGFVQRRLLEIPRHNTGHSFLIRRMNWNRAVYNTLLVQKNQAK